ncbi:peptidoglycan/xylan/chitin deacetylase (PgdA/CDA1 family) [Azorhizobium sp. AG788]|uniref:polysaccharide deacetylase family protein n=1 Tax=Azorhizobium sp. AG788 TaxID=2183897 RepID=UPI00105F048C|nr:polysaccharide deacetylase family protein [Azorhizobium sp. AG788]TDT90334.1 peptidoglycan/xylan/chitin deacetylase (PgdA/CDA1 family) [Azorhizobium sp. AG788]
MPASNVSRTCVLLATVLAAVLSFAPARPASAASAAAACPGRPDALGTARVIEVPAGVQVGTKSFPQTLPLEKGEVVLTFDDGPWPHTTAAILDALKAECVKATFFLIGENARARPELVKREIAEGHTVAHHSMTHPDATLAKLPFPAAVAEITKGMAADDLAAYGSAGSAEQLAPRVPFFRFPGFASTPELLEALRARGVSVFGADFWASDWNKMTPEQELALVLQRLDATGGGIVLFHDTKAQTAAMIPAFLRALAQRGYRVVHMVPARQRATQR